MDAIEVSRWRILAGFDHDQEFAKVLANGMILEHLISESVRTLPVISM
jgi:hypothetical protein